MPSPFAQTGFEPSPIDRIVEQGAAGNPWQLSTSGVTGSGHTVKVTYTNNDQSTLSNAGSRQAALFMVTINADESRTLTRAGNNATYANSQLTVTITTDENWTTASGCLNTVEEYKDMLGRVVLKRTYNLKNSIVEMLSTYYIYDDKGNLCFVLPPGANPDAVVAITQATLDNLCYQYRYDGRSRLTQKKIPGKGWEFMIYNAIDQPVLSQDANQRNQTPQLTTFTKYDALGRAIMIGQAPVPGNPAADNNMSAPNQAYRQSLEGYYLTTTNPLWEGINNTGFTGYTNTADPVVAGNAYYTINYYDNYGPNFPLAYAPPAGASAMTQGLPTASKTEVLNTINNSTPDMLWAVHYYDNLGRNIQSYSQHYLGGTTVLNLNNYDVVANTYDFTNKATASTRTHYNTTSTNPIVTIADTYVYDQVDRIKQTFENINAGTNVLLSQLDYNEVGQPMTKHLHSTTGGAPFMQDIGYIYNERGWLLSSSASLFQFQLQYNTSTVAGISPTAQYNGNIASQSWGTLSLPNTKSYTYNYDNLNRLTAGTSTDNYNESGITYDQLGNIQTLQRTWNSTTPIDNLAYNYSNSTGNYTNQVQSITDASTDISGKGYKMGTFSYQYDMNGNLTQDNSKGVSLTYNMLNLPQNATLLLSCVKLPFISYW